jgi:DNA-binding response OmpR family regulator
MLASPEIKERHVTPENLWFRGRLVINLESREVTFNQIGVAGLTKTEYQILLTLAERPGRVFTHSALEKIIYNQEGPVGPRTMGVHISNLRAKLPDHDLIKTIYGIGYKLSSDV